MTNSVPNPKHSSDSFEHYTPPEYVEAARSIMGEITLDPATTARVNSRFVRAATYYTLEDNGFNRTWERKPIPGIPTSEQPLQRVFLNPPGGLIDAQGKPLTKRAPGSQSSARAWWFKLANEYACRRVACAVFVGFSLELLQTAQAGPLPGPNGRALPHPLEFPICVLRKRIQFLTAREGYFAPGASPTHANFLSFLPARWDADQEESFHRLFGQFGWTHWPCRVQEQDT